MEMEYSTVKIKFFLMGFSDHPELQDALIAMFLFIFSVIAHGEPQDENVTRGSQEPNLYFSQDPGFNTG